MADFRSHMGVVLMDFMGDESTVIHAAKLSTLGAKSPEKSEAKGFLSWLAREGHTVPFEHVVLSFRLEVPIFVSRQVVKYRHTSISEESGRYKELEPIFYFPKRNRPVVQIGKTGDYNFIEDEEKYNLTCRQIIQSSLDAWGSYSKLLNEGVAKEVARMVLPVNIYSTMRVTGNLVHWLHFISQRATEAPSHGQREIADVANQIGECIAERFPTIWNQFVENGYKL